MAPVSRTPAIRTAAVNQIASVIRGAVAFGLVPGAKAVLAETAAAFIPEALVRTLFNGITAMLVQPAVQQPWLTWMQAFQMGVAVGVLSLCLLFGAICLFRGRPTHQPVVVHIPVQQPAPEHQGNPLRRSLERLKG